MIRTAVAAVLVAGVLACVSHLLQAWMTISGRYLFTLGGADPRKPAADLPQLLQADIREGHSFYLQDFPAWLRGLAATPSVIYAVVVGVAVVLVVRMLRLIAAGDAFGAGVLGTLKWLSITLVVGAVLHGAADTAAGRAVFDWNWELVREGAGLAPIQGLGVDLPHWPVMFVVLGLISAALAVAFRQGARLREEMAGVV